MKGLLETSLLTLATSTFIIASQDLQYLSGKISASSLFARQGSCGVGATCAEACGTGWETCDHDPYCYNPTAGDVCYFSSTIYALWLTRRIDLLW